MACRKLFFTFVTPELRLVEGRLPMTLLVWNNGYSVGIASIDEQHKKLVDMLNELFDGMQSSKGREVLGKILDELIDYANMHFKFEEDIFNRVGYPDLMSHKAQHDELRQKVIAIQERYKAAQTGALSLEVINFMRGWLVNHIQGTDMKYSPFLLSKGVA
jgi:hemerythrin